MHMNNIINLKAIKKDFPLLANSKIVYLDNAATTQKPKAVINAIKRFYERENANIHRGLYDLSVKATEKYEEARRIVAEFINAGKNEIIFTRSATESINLLANSLPKLFNGKDEIVLSEMEHHSNLVPWQETAKRFGLKLKFIRVNKNYELSLIDAKRKITNKTAIVSVAHVSNAFGTINDIRNIIKLARKKNAIVVIDAAQSAPHMRIDVNKLDCDFLTFSGHKIYGPTGIGILYGKAELLNKMPPFQFGGDMIKSVTLEKTIFDDPPGKFEAGTQNIAGSIGLGEAIKYINKIGMKNIEKYEKSLLKYAFKKLNNVRGITLYAPLDGVGIISFNLEGIPPHDLASLLNDNGISVRAGHHCCMPMMSNLGIAGTARVSLSFYNTKEDIDSLIEGLNAARKIFK